MANILTRYTRWLHTRWPAGTVEPLPLAREDGSTNVPGLYVVGDLTGILLLKFSSDSGARAVQTMLADPSFQGRSSSDAAVLDLVVIGAGVSGVAAMAEAKNAGLKAEIIEAAEPFSTVVNFPKAKPIYTYPTEMTPAGELQFGPKSDVKEGLVEELQEFMRQRGIKPRMARVERVQRKGGIFEVKFPDGSTIAAHRVIVGIGRSGNFRKLGVPGENLGKVFNRLHDPKEFAGKNVLVVGGGDSALETAIAIAQFGGKVTLSYRNKEFSRPKPENIEKLTMLAADPMADVAIEEPMSERITTSTGGFMEGYKKAGSIRLMLGSKVKSIGDQDVTTIDVDGQEQTIPNDAVFAMIGREAPLDFFRRSGVHIRGEWRASTWISLVLVLLAAIFVYHWKKTGVHIADVQPLKWLQGIGDAWVKHGLFPYNVPQWWASLGAVFSDRANLFGTLKISLGEPGFYYSLAYCSCVAIFGVRRIRRRKTPYVTIQTLTLATIQIVPLFLLPYLLLPWAGNNDWFASGTTLGWLADQLFPLANYGHGREYWRAFGLILAWPLFIWNVFTEQPMWAWLIISLVQTCVLIPGLIYYFGKGVYCGWVCSCGALAETMGDAHRHKMPHGPFWNRANMIGQVFLAFAMILLVLRFIAWATPAPLTVRVTEVRYGELSADASHIETDPPIGAGYSWPDGSIRLPSGTIHDNISKTTGLFVDGDLREIEGQEIQVRRAFTFLNEWTAKPFQYLFSKVPVVNYVWFVDLFWAGILGVGLYWHFSGRVWCRFACPLAALMHVYARFSRFAIVADKKKCISCNVCTSVCHQGIDIMNFANKGLPMQDPQCVRCSACVQSCPTGVLEFGQVDPRTGATLKKDPKWLAASPVLMRESAVTINGRRIR